MTGVNVPDEAVALPKTIQCFRCGYKPRVLKDATLAVHGKRRDGKLVWECPDSGKLAPLHVGTFNIISRNPDGSVIWLAKCACGQGWTGPEYADVDTPWSAHSTAEMDKIRARAAELEAGR